MNVLRHFLDQNNIVRAATEIFSNSKWSEMLVRLTAVFVSDMLTMLNT